MIIEQPNNKDLGRSEVIIVETSYIMAPRVFDSIREIEVDETLSHLRKEERPVPPVAHGDGTIFVSIASYRGTFGKGTIESRLDQKFIPMEWNMAGWLVAESIVRRVGDAGMNEEE
jgi:hypothetical protein